LSGRRISTAMSVGIVDCADRIQERQARFGRFVDIAVVAAHHAVCMEKAHYG